MNKAYLYIAVLISIFNFTSLHATSSISPYTITNQTNDTWVITQVSDKNSCVKQNIDLEVMPNSSLSYTLVYTPKDIWCAAGGDMHGGTRLKYYPKSEGSMAGNLLKTDVFLECKKLNCSKNFIEPTTCTCALVWLMNMKEVVTEGTKYKIHNSTSVRVLYISDK